MDENLTWEIFDAEEFYNAMDDVEEFVDYEVMASFEKYLFPILIVSGLFFNIVALVILVRRSLWLQHEAYVYLATILVNNTIQLGAVYVPWWLALFHESYHVAYTSEVVCKFWILLTRLIQSSGWFQIAMLCSVYVHLRLETNERGNMCSTLCRKCCTLRGALISVALLLIASAVVNLWYFVNATVHHFDGEVRFCYAGEVTASNNRYVKLALNCLVNYIPVIVLTPVLWVMIVISKNRRFGFGFTRMMDEGPSSCDVDAEELGKVTLWLSLVLYVLRSPFHLMHMLDESNVFHNYRAYFISYAVCLLHPVAFAIVCFVVLRRFREEVKAMAMRCWSCTAAIRHRRRRISLPVAWSSGSTLVLQLDTTLDAGTDA